MSTAPGVQHIDADVRFGGSAQRTRMPGLGANQSHGMERFYVRFMTWAHDSH